MNIVKPTCIRSQEEVNCCLYPSLSDIRTSKDVLLSKKLVSANK